MHRTITHTFTLLLLVSTLFLSGCFTHQHVVGKGAQGAEVIEQRQWYVLWGLVPINEVDTRSLAAGTTDYTITTEQSLVDSIISIFTGVISVYPRTIIVEK